MKTKSILMMLSLLVMFVSCGKRLDDYGGKSTWEYKNNSSHTIKVYAGIDARFNFALDKGAEHSFDLSVGTGKEVTADSFESPYSSGVPSITIDSERVITASRITDIKDYGVEKISERHYKFTYTFTDADFPAE